MKADKNDRMRVSCKIDKQQMNTQAREQLEQRTRERARARTHKSSKSVRELSEVDKTLGF